MSLLEGTGPLSHLVPLKLVYLLGKLVQLVAAYGLVQHPYLGQPLFLLL